MKTVLKVTGIAIALTTVAAVIRAIENNYYNYNHVPMIEDLN